MTHKVTVVIPIYADWPTMKLCLESLKKYLAPEHQVLIINDAGPEADMLETNIQKSIKGHPNFHYYRNPKNLGFVGTCNRAVLELDKTGNDILLLNSDTAVTKGFLEELLAVLYAKPNHGAVSPRSNSATYANIPLKPRGGVMPSPEDSYHLFQAIHKKFPRYHQAVDAPGSFLLTRRSLVDKYGFLDEIYSPGYAEETDFCLRLRRHGFISVFANWAYVYHYRAMTFTSERKQMLKERNKKIIIKRYPELPRLIEDYLERLDAVDWFADLIDGPAKPLKILLDLEGWPDSAVNQLWPKTKPTGIDLAVTVKRSGQPSFVRVVSPAKTDELFHVGYSRQPGYDLQRICLRLVANKTTSIDALQEIASKPLELDDLRDRWHHLKRPKAQSPKLADRLKRRLINMVKS